MALNRSRHISLFLKKGSLDPKAPHPTLPPPSPPKEGSGFQYKSKRKQLPSPWGRAREGSLPHRIFIKSAVFQFVLHPIELV